MPFQCDRCGHCCRTHRVPLTVTDLRRLARNPHVADLDGCVEWLSSESIDFDDEPESFVELREGRAVPFLRHVPTDASGLSPTSAAPSQCVFLSAQGCQVFSERPSACRSYPYDRPRLDQDKVRLTLAPTVQCPSATDVFVTLRADPLLDPTAREYTQLITERDGELSGHATWVERHNRLMALLLRMSRTRLTGAQTLKRMLAHETRDHHPF